MVNMYINKETEQSIDEYLAPPDIHDENYQDFSGAPLVILFAIALTIGHCLNIYLLLWQETALALNVILHVILVAIAWILVFLLKRAGLDVRMAMLMLVTSSVLGPVGTAGTLLAVLQGIFYVRYRHSFEEWFNSIFPKAEPSLPEDIVDALEMGRDNNPYEYSVIPFMDVMKIGNEAQKREALSRMASSFHPRFSAALKTALTDESSAIRVQAATTITKIENKFHERLLRIEQLHREHPQNPVVKKALAEHYDDYAFTGLLDIQRELSNRQKARELYLEYLQLRPEDIDVRLKVGRLLIRSEELDQAVDWFKHSLDEGYATDALKIWYMECLFKAGRFDELRAAASTFHIDLNHYKNLQPEMVETIHLWAQAGASQKLESA